MINELKDLEKLLKLCRKQGVTKIELGSVKLELGELPIEQKSQDIQDQSNQLDGFPDGILTPDQLLFYSAGGLPADDPYTRGETN